MRLATLLIEHIGRDIIECRIDYAAVYCVLSANMIFVGRKYSSTCLAIKTEIDVQSNRIVMATGKAHRCRFDLIRQCR